MLSSVAVAVSATSSLILGEVKVLLVRVSAVSFSSVPFKYNDFPEARFKCSDEVHEFVPFTQLKVLFVAPLRVIPPPSAVVSVGTGTSPITMFLSSTTRLIELMFVVVPFTVKSPETVRLTAVAVPVNAGAASGAFRSNAVCVAVETGLLASVVLSTFPSPT